MLTWSFHYDYPLFFILKYKTFFKLKNDTSYLLNSFIIRLNVGKQVSDDIQNVLTIEIFEQGHII